MTDKTLRFMNSKIQAEVGLILGYLLLLYGSLFWDISPFQLLFSLIVDYASLLLVYVVISVARSKTFFDIVITMMSKLFNGLALGFIQGALVLFLARLLEGETSFYLQTSNLGWFMLLVAIPMVLLQFLQLLGKPFNADLEGAKMSELMMAAVTFPAVLLMGLLAFELSNEDSDIALTVVVLTRISIAIWNNHFRIQSSDQKKSPTKR